MPRPASSRRPITRTCWPRTPGWRSTSWPTSSPNPTFDESELAREKSVILQEIGAVEDTPDDLVFDLFNACAYPGQAIGRPILGTPEGVNGFDRATIGRYLSRHYHGRRHDRRGGRRRRARAPRRRGRHALRPAGDDARAKTLGPARRPRYIGGETRLKRRLEQAHVVVGLRGRRLRPPRPLRAADLRQRRRRRHVLAAVPGRARETRPRLFHLRLPLGLFRHRPVRLLRRNEPARCWRVDAGGARFDRRGERDAERGRGAARQGPGPRSRCSPHSNRRRLAPSRSPASCSPSAACCRARR